MTNPPISGGTPANEVKSLSFPGAELSENSSSSCSDSTKRRGSSSSSICEPQHTVSGACKYVLIAQRQEQTDYTTHLFNKLSTTYGTCWIRSHLLKEKKSAKRLGKKKKKNKS